MKVWMDGGDFRRLIFQILAAGVETLNIGGI